MRIRWVLLALFLIIPSGPPEETEGQKLKRKWRKRLIGLGLLGIVVGAGVYANGIINSQKNQFEREMEKHGISEDDAINFYDHGGERIVSEVGIDNPNLPLAVVLNTDSPDVYDTLNKSMYNDPFVNPSIASELLVKTAADLVTMENPTKATIWAAGNVTLAERSLGELSPESFDSMVGYTQTNPDGPLFDFRYPETGNTEKELVKHPNRANLYYTIGKVLEQREISEVNERLLNGMVLREFDTTEDILKLYDFYEGLKDIELPEEWAMSNLINADETMFTEHELKYNMKNLASLPTNQLNGLTIRKDHGASQEVNVTRWIEFVDGEFQDLIDAWYDPEIYDYGGGFKGTRREWGKLIYEGWLYDRAGWGLNETVNQYREADAILSKEVRHWNFTKFMIGYGRYKYGEDDGESTYYPHMFRGLGIPFTYLGFAPAPNYASMSQWATPLTMDERVMLNEQLPYDIFYGEGGGFGLKSMVDGGYLDMGVNVRTYEGMGNVDVR